MCAIEAGKQGRRTAVLDLAERPGKKFLISGGGRCNFTNIHCKPENFLSSNPHFAKSALARYTPRDIIALVDKHGIPYHEKTLGQLFCDRSAKDIIRMLERECAEGGAEIHTNVEIRSVRRAEEQNSASSTVVSGGEFIISAAHHEFRATSLVVATGGLSIPKI